MTDLKLYFLLLFALLLLCSFVLDIPVYFKSYPFSVTDAAKDAFIKYI